MRDPSSNQENSYGRCPGHTGTTDTVPLRPEIVKETLLDDAVLQNLSGSIETATYVELNANMGIMPDS